MIWPKMRLDTLLLIDLFFLLRLVGGRVEMLVGGEAELNRRRGGGAQR